MLWLILQIQKERTLPIKTTPVVYVAKLDETQRQAICRKEGFKWLLSAKH